MILTVTSTMNSEEIKAEYTSSLADLTFNSKPLINVLTILAEENLEHASDIVAAIENHLTKVQTEVKLPILYLIDCIAKNIGNTYRTLFSQNIVTTFCNVFKVVDEKTRAEMFKLRQTWNEIFPQKKLYAIDVQINMLDPAWPVTAAPPSNSIHFNPKFLNPPKTKVADTVVTKTVPIETPNLDSETFTMQQKLIQKQKELIELQQKKLELELLQTQVKLQKQKKAVASTSTTTTRPQNILLKPEVAKQLTPATSRDGIKLKASELAIPRQSPSTGHKIAPVNSALVAAAVAAAARPTIRDPRLLRQTEKLASQQQRSSTTNNKDSSNNSQLPDNKLDKPSNNKTFLKQSRQTEQKNKKPQTIRSSKTNDTNESKSYKDRLLDSPSKTKNDKGDLSKSPTKSSPSRYKKKSSEHSSSADKKVFKDSKRDRDIKSHKHDTSSSAFKGVKNSTKNRNYIRRNRSPSFSPEPNVDIDLRITGPPEKQAKLQGDHRDEQCKIGMDVDLRQLPSAINKKRLSSETAENNPTKKTKSEMFDVLFGHEDTDLRTVLPVAQPDRPPTPPPPIISHAEKDPVKNSNLDAVRAKLANATGRAKILAKTYRKKREEDVRPPPKPTLNDSMKKIIISSDDEQCIKAGTMTKEQEKQLMNKIIAQIEHQKLKEAQEKDKKESDQQLQPVSDEELEVIEDKDDRMNYQKSTWDPRDNRRGGSGNYWRGSKRRHWEPPPHSRQQQQPSIRPWLDQPSNSNSNNPWRPMATANSTFNNNRQQMQIDYQDEGTRSPVPSDLVVDSVNQDDIKTINIDGVPRDIRYYDETAIVFMNWDDPKEISFQNGTRRVAFDDKDIYYLSFNEGYKDLNISGSIHRVRLGAPSREIFIDGKPYECYFGGPPITIDVNGQMIVVKLDGPAPQVKIGTVKRMDLVAGKVNLIIDAKILVPVFLDAKVQKFVIDSETHTLKFVDALKTVLINDVPFKVEFGGLPKPITVHDKKHFIRFSVLPRGVKPGIVSIKDMEGSQGQDNTANLLLEQNSESQDGMSSTFASHDINEPALPVFGRNKKRVEDEVERNSNSPHFFQNFMQQNNFDLFSTVMGSSSTMPSSNGGGYQVETQNSQSMDSTTLPLTSTSNNSNPVSLLPPTLNINDLFQKLVATGIVVKDPQVPTAQTNLMNVVNTHSSSSSQQSKQPPPEPEQPAPVRKHNLEVFKAATFKKPETLKVRQSALYDILYSGMQCSSCGMRFPPEQSIHYSQHLDWHFRQNRKGKKNIRVAASRRWYYSLSDWKNYEEIEDLEEREKNYFDQQQSQIEGAGDDAEEEVEIPSVPADPDVQEALCEVCQDKFDLFFNEDKEEWHLRNAIRVEEKTYHPVCFDDYQTSLQSMEHYSTKEESSQDDDDTGAVQEEKADEQNIPGLEIILDDEDEEIDENSENAKTADTDQNDDEVVIEESDDSKQNGDGKPEDESGDAQKENEEEDDDVILHEIALERIEIDDDKEYIDTIAPNIPVKIEQIDDGFMDVEEGLITIKNGGQIKIKSEPIDPDELPAIDESIVPEEPSQFTDTAQPVLISSMDGNTDLAQTVPTSTASIGGKIKINISKALPVIPPKESKDNASENAVPLDSIIDPSQPLPPGEEPIQLNVKPALRGIELKKMPVVKKGSELTGMCSIM